MTGFAATTGAACLTGAADAWAGCDLLMGCVLIELATGCALTAGRGFAAPWPLEIGVEAAVLDILDTADFFGGTDICFLAGDGGATFLGTGLAILLAAGAFLAVLLLPDEWAGLEAAFFAGAIFLTFTVFLAGLAAFFLVAIQLGFFSNNHF
jgi:hypothetical protein